MNFVVDINKSDIVEIVIHVGKFGINLIQFVVNEGQYPFIFKQGISAIMELEFDDVKHMGMGLNIQGKPVLEENILHFSIHRSVTVDEAELRGNVVIEDSLEGKTYFIPIIFNVKEESNEQ